MLTIFVNIILIKGFNSLMTGGGAQNTGFPASSRAGSPARKAIAFTQPE
jgi:hypothetical protein